MNKLKDQLLDKDIDYHNINKNAQTEVARTSKVTSSLSYRIEELEKQIQSLSSSREIERMAKEQLSN